MEATVVKHTGSHYLLSALPEWNLFPAVLRGKIRLKGSTATNPVAVGDRVSYEFTPNMSASGSYGRAGESGLPSAGSDVPTEQNPAVITAVLPRRNYVIRRSTNLSRQAHIIAANVDRAFIVVTIDFPEVKLPFLDRLLVTCEVYNVPVTIVLNKCDLYTGEYQDRLSVFHSIYEGAGYSVMDVSAVTGQGIDMLREACKGAVSLFSGVSGVGKSSLVNRVEPGLHLKVEEISDAHDTGRHTTTFAEMFPLREGGYVVDTPGIRAFGLIGMEKGEISHYFPEIFRCSAGCRYNNCTHTHEPGCAVVAAVESGEISESRYFSYTSLLEEGDDKYRKSDY